MITVSNDGMGRGDVELQRRLMKTYLTMLLDNDYRPAAVCLYTEGVRLVCEGSPVLDELRTLAERGVAIIICQTCLNYFNLGEKRRVGIVGGMADIIEAQWLADKVIAL